MVIMPPPVLIEVAAFGFGLGDELISPCMCKGTQRFVHRSCLDHWRSVKVMPVYLPNYYYLFHLYQNSIHLLRLLFILTFRFLSIIHIMLDYEQ